MRKACQLLVVLCLAVSVAVAQAPTPGSICEVHTNKVKPGMTAQYEQGRTKHMAWHKAQNDAWSWAVWEVTTGDGTGNYVVASCGHQWKDFDGREKFNDADGANANETIGASIAGSTMSYYIQRPELSSPSQPGPPPPYLNVIHFYLKPEGVNDFTEAAKKIIAAFEKTNTPRGTANFYSLVTGGTGPEMVLVQDRKSISELAGPSQKTLDQMMQEAYGPDGAATLAKLRKAYYRTYSEFLRYRTDLSYMAPRPTPKP
jgi:hypothetical protein